VQSTTASLAAQIVMVHSNQKTHIKYQLQHNSIDDNTSNFFKPTCHMKQVPVTSVLKFQNSFLAKHKISIHSTIQISYQFMEYLPVTLQEDGYLVPCTNIHLFLVYVNTVGDVGRLLFHGQQHIASVVIKAYGWQHKASLNLGQDTKLTTQPTFSF